MQLLETHTATTQNTPIRLQEYAVGIFSSLPTKSGIKKAIKKGLLLVDGKLTSTAVIIKGGETLELYLPKETNLQKRFNFPLEVLLEDDHLAIVNKPAGIPVSGTKFATIDNALEQNLQKSTLKDAARPRPVHRLDHPTSGLLVVGKTNECIRALNKLFENREVLKTYHAVTVRKMKQTGIIDLLVDGKESFSEYRVLQTVSSDRFDCLNLVQLNPKTGRRHQLRKHLAAVGHPILGDKKYGIASLLLKGKGLYLHASALVFTHPFTKENLNITKELPKKFRKLFPQ